jgi:hypothetical protein
VNKDARDATPRNRSAEGPLSARATVALDWGKRPDLRLQLFALQETVKQPLAKPEQGSLALSAQGRPAGLRPLR